ALAVAGALGAIGLFAPLDWLIWTGHSRIVERPASGETVFVAAAEDLSEPTKPERRLSLSTLIDELSKAGAERIFLDVRFAQPSALAADEALKRSIEESGRTYLVDRFQTTVAGPRMLSTIEPVAGSAPSVVARHRHNLFGWAWWADSGSVEEGEFRQSLASALADGVPEAGAPFRIDYSISHLSVPSTSMQEVLSSLSEDQKRRLFEKKLVVVG